VENGLKVVRLVRVEDLAHEACVADDRKPIDFQQLLDRQPVR
jgi:hypothetical protein